jgi:hypothetical protein
VEGLTEAAKGAALRHHPQAGADGAAHREPTSTQHEVAREPRGAALTRIAYTSGVHENGASLTSIHALSARACYSHGRASYRLPWHPSRRPEGGTPDAPVEDEACRPRGPVLGRHEDRRAAAHALPVQDQLCVRVRMCVYA